MISQTNKQTKTLKRLKKTAEKRAYDLFPPEVKVTSILMPVQPTHFFMGWLPLGTPQLVSRWNPRKRQKFDSVERETFTVILVW